MSVSQVRRPAALFTWSSTCSPRSVPATWGNVTDTVECLTGHAPRAITRFARDAADAFRRMAETVVATPG